MGTAISWTSETWNPTTGCSKVSPGCSNCYAERLSLRFGWSKKPWTPENAAENVVLHPERLDMPLRWKKPRLIFVDSMSDLFHERVTDEFIADVFAVMRLADHHSFQVLTKRSERMRAFLSDGLTSNWIRNIAASGQQDVLREEWVWPLPNVWLGVSVENQRMADERIPLLLDTPASVRFLSVEPLLGAVDLRLSLTQRCWCGEIRMNCDCPKLDWVIAGGESGGPEHRRLVERCACKSVSWLKEEDCPGWLPKPQALSWLRSLREQCQAAKVPFFFKQWGGPKPTSGGRLLDGRTWDEMP